MKKGDTVKLSAEGLRVFNRPSKNGVMPVDRRATVLSTGDETRRPLSDGCVRIQWDHCAGPETIAKVFLEVAEEALA